MRKDALAAERRKEHDDATTTTTTGRRDDSCLSSRRVENAVRCFCNCCAQIVLLKSCNSNSILYRLFRIEILVAKTKVTQRRC